jgi:hypothetical protein
MNERFIIPARLKMTSIALMAVGILTIIVGAITLLGSSDNLNKIRFWDGLLHNSIFFLVISAASIFIIAASALAQGGWIVAYRRIPEAIGANVWLFGLIATVIMFLVAFTFKIHGPHGDYNPIYKWMTPINPETGAVDEIVAGKSNFLNGKFFGIFTIIAVGLWSFFGLRFRNMSVYQDSAPRNSTKTYWRVVTFGGLFLLVYALTQMSTTPWLWVMSVDAHWYSTMFSWYSFASAFVTGMGLILMWVVYLKNQGYLSIVGKEHVHDLGKLMFAFSIFWTYVWFAQFMLIWYGNIPEETTYFKIRMDGPYSVIWYAVLIICFVMPILILMSRPSKRNFFTVTFMAMVIFFGHWLDYYQMIYPGTLGAHWHLSWYEIGVLCGFIGTFMFSVATSLSKHALVPSNHPLLKESILHVS